MKGAPFISNLHLKTQEFRTISDTTESILPPAIVQRSPQRTPYLKGGFIKALHL